ncbi:MAG: DUF1700 domain-containing protein [Lachnospiraceae bacterium]|nr:DUF1700 domain-containing protein [Candidatus Colinaster equi]
MKKDEYLKELEACLSDISSEEREDALAYYSDYIEAGGEENEEATIASLGSAAELAKTIRLANNDTNVIDGEFTENGYSDSEKTYESLQERTAIVKNDTNVNKNKTSASKIILIVILAIFALPILGPVALGILGTLFGLGVAAIAVVAGVAIVLFAIGIAGFVCGIVGIVIGALSLFGPGGVWGGMVIIGGSVICLAIGCLFTCLLATGLIKAIPPVVRGIVDICIKFINWLKNLFCKKEKEA